MLRKLLAYIAQGKLTYQEIMQRLEISTELMGALLAELVRKGYLEIVESSSCSSCSTCPGCSAGTFCGSSAEVANSWQLTDSGRAYLERARSAA